MRLPAGLAATFTLAFALSASAQPCVDGHAAGFPCDRVDLLALLPVGGFGATAFQASDIWGWTDPDSGREFVLLGLASGTAFIEITNPLAPTFLGTLPAHGAPSPWRDIKVHANHALVVSEAEGHGLQVFDLGQLRNVTAPPVTFAETAHYGAEFLSFAHNIAVNEATGFAYIVGSNTCEFGLHMVNVQNPQMPQFAGCFAEDGYTHDAQCVVYQGADSEHQGREVCFAFNEDTLTIVDVTEKSAPRMLSRSTYEGVAYTHQGWLTEDHLYLLLGDELDEVNFGHATITRIWDIADLDRPVHRRNLIGDTPAIDHNLYVRGHHLYQANYRAGLRVFHLDLIEDGRLERLGFFDVYPADDAPEFNGAWGVYPFFPSGVLAVSSIDHGLFLLQLVQR